MSLVLHHHPATLQPPSLRRSLLLSLGIHAAVLGVLTFSLAKPALLAPPPAIRVQLVGIPQPSPRTQPKQEPEPIRTQDSPAPKEPPPNARTRTQEATSRLTQPVSPTTPQARNDVAAAERPPVLDKTPQEKKVVKNEPDAKVVRNPEDFLAQLDFVDDLAAQASQNAANAAPSSQPAGEGPQLQVNLADSGLVGTLRDHISREWLIPPGLDVRDLAVTVWVSLDAQGNLSNLRVTRSSGQDFFDNSLLRAVRKAMPLPIPADQLSRFRELELTFQAP